MKLTDAIVSSVGAAISLAWIFDAGSVLDLTGTSRMVLPTSLAFVFAGIMVGALKSKHRDPVRLAMNAFAVLGILITSTFSALYTTWTGRWTVAAGLPSVGTLLAFNVIFLCGILRALREDHHKTIAVMMGSIAVIGAEALCGWGLRIPEMYFYAPHRSTGMSPITAMCFVLLGLGYLWDMRHRLIR